MSKELTMLSPSKGVSMADEWFELADKNHFWMRWRFKLIEKKMKAFLELTSKMKFLEIGCGHGQFIEQCEDALPISVDGSDLNTYALKQIKNARGNIFVYNIFDRNKDLLNRYDVIFLLDVIEHIDDDHAFMSAALDHVKPGGLVVVNVPALKILFSKYDVVAGHKRRYSKKQIDSLFTKLGIRPVSIFYWGMLMLPVAMFRKIYLRFVPQENAIKAGFKPNRIANVLFRSLMKVEFLLGGEMVCGTSVLAIGKKL